MFTWLAAKHVCKTSKLAEGNNPTLLDQYYLTACWFLDLVLEVIAIGYLIKGWI